MNIKRFNEYRETEQFNQSLIISKDEINDMLADLEEEYDIELDPIRFEAKSDLSPKSKFCATDSLIQVGPIQIDGFKLGFLTDWCENGDIWPKKFNGLGYKLNIKKKGKIEIIKNTNEITKILKRLNHKRLKSFGLKSQIIRGAFSWPFIIIFKINHIK